MTPKLLKPDNFSHSPESGLMDGTATISTKKHKSIRGSSPFQKKTISTNKNL
jgi:hypothetical protein